MRRYVGRSVDRPPEPPRRDRRRLAVPRHEVVGRLRRRGERRQVLVEPAQPPLLPRRGVEPEHRPRPRPGPAVRLDQPDAVA